MCCLFGIIDYRNSLKSKQKNRMLGILAAASEDRGTDAAGIAYNTGGKLHIYKRPRPAHCLRFHVPERARVIMGHTRMATQGSELKNYNNHPFQGHTREGPFALAHNGILYNDKALRLSLDLPESKIETDSFIAVGLLEQKGTLNFSALRYVAEAIEGSFCLSILDSRDNLYLVKGDNPLCLYHFPKLGLYLYATTESILRKALCGMGLSGREHSVIPLECGEILRISPAGNLEREEFNDSHLFFSRWLEPWLPRPYGNSHRAQILEKPDPYLEEIKRVSFAFGYTPEAIEHLAAIGFSAEELENFLYEGGI